MEEVMSKTWMFEETGEVRNPQIDEWYAYGMDTKTGGCVASAFNHDTKSPILKLTEYPSNPLEPIREVWEKNNHFDVLLNDPAWSHDNLGYSIATDLWRAIRKCMEIVEGK